MTAVAVMYGHKNSPKMSEPITVALRYGLTIMEIWHRKCRIKNPRRQTMPKKSLGKKRKKAALRVVQGLQSKTPICVSAYRLGAAKYL